MINATITIGTDIGHIGPTDIANSQSPTIIPKMITIVQLIIK